MYHNEELFEMGDAVAYHMARLWLIGEWNEWKEGQEERARWSFGVQRQDDWLEMSRMGLSIMEAAEWSKSIGLLDETAMWLSPKVGPDEFLARWVEAVELIPAGWRCKVLSACLVSPWEMGWCGYDHTQMDLYERVRRVAEGEADIRLVEAEAAFVLDAVWQYRIAAEMTVDRIVAQEEKQNALEASIREHKEVRDRAAERIRVRDEEAARRTAELQAQARELQRQAEERKRAEREARARRAREAEEEKRRKKEEKEREKAEKAAEKEALMEQRKIERLIAAEEKRQRKEADKKRQAEMRRLQEKQKDDEIRKEREEKRMVREGMEIANRLLRTSGVYKHLGWRAEVRAREAERDAEKRARVIRRLGLKEADCDGVSTKALLEVWHKQARERRRR